MIFGNPYHFAIWTELVPQWSESYKNGLFHLVINGSLYPDDNNLKKGKVVGDGLEHDHIPSFAALKKAKENELGRKLTPTEEKTLYQNATAVEVPKDVHQSGPTYGGKNTAAQVQQDAIDLCGAVCRDTDALRGNMIDRGYDPKQVDEAIKQIIDRNRQTGVIK